MNETPHVLLFKVIKYIVHLVHPSLHRKFVVDFQALADLRSLRNELQGGRFSIAAELSYSHKAVNVKRHQDHAPENVVTNQGTCVINHPVKFSKIYDYH